MDIKQLMTLASFRNNVKIIPYSNSDACWEWQGGSLPNGYGVASIGSSKTELAHRFIAGFLEDVKDKVVLHTCDNPCCVRPDHLRVGTQQDNMRDMFNKDRSNSKLNRTAVLDIRTRILSRPEYAKKYGIAVGTVGDIQRKSTWKHI